MVSHPPEVKHETLLFDLIERISAANTITTIFYLTA